MIRKRYNSISDEESALLSARWILDGDSPETTGIAGAAESFSKDEFEDLSGARSESSPKETTQPESTEIADIWMQRSGKASLLSAQEEVVLAKAVERGDQRAREELMNANVRLVASVARRYMGRGLPLEDLMQEGMIGLIRAIEKFNYRKGYRFSTYATHWIRQSVSRGLANQGRSIRLPAHVVDSLSRVSKAREELVTRLGRIPTRGELAFAAGMTEARLQQLTRHAQSPLPLDAPIGADNEATMGDFLAAGEESSPSDHALNTMLKDEISVALDTLLPREREVIVLRYGLDNDDPQTLEETGKRMRITRERARQIEGKALAKLRHASVSTRLREAVS